MPKRRSRKPPLDVARPRGGEAPLPIRAAARDVLQSLPLVACVLRVHIGEPGSRAYRPPKIIFCDDDSSRTRQFLFLPPPLQEAKGKGYLALFFFVCSVFRGLKPTARNIELLRSSFASCRSLLESESFANAALSHSGRNRREVCKTN